TFEQDIERLFDNLKVSIQNLWSSGQPDSIPILKKKNNKFQIYIYKMDAIDANEYLIQFLGSIDNLPSEIRHHFSEISNREQEIDDLLKGIERRKKRLWCLYDGGSFDSDCSVVEIVKVITEFEDEEMLKEKVMNDYIRVSQLQDEKIEITDKALAL
ncbi:6073_t:CDS:2, partial [Entrophospora sp. SA101]